MKKFFVVMCVLAMVLVSGCASKAVSSLIVKEVSVRNNSAQVHFQPGCKKYIAECRNKKTTLTPNAYNSTWGEGSLEVGSMHSFRTFDGGFDQLWITVKGEKVNQDFEVDLTCLLENGATTSKKVRIVNGKPSIVSMDEGEIVISLEMLTELK